MLCEPPPPFFWALWWLTPPLNGSDGFSAEKTHPFLAENRVPERCILDCFDPGHGKSCSWTSNIFCKIVLWGCLETACQFSRILAYFMKFTDEHGHQGDKRISWNAHEFNHGIEFRDFFLIFLSWAKFFVIMIMITQSRGISWWNSGVFMSRFHDRQSLNYCKK